ncbi:hypothetical protein RCWATERBOI_21 [Rhodobacter phage RcWaterboi]|nr:hypothetical protein RCWATERBOI_21 [Rhodobacter phage RcWaterboi]
MISTDFGVHINPQFVAAMKWTDASTSKLRYRVLHVIMWTGEVFDIEASPVNCGADDIEAAILKAHAGLA